MAGSGQTSEYLAGTVVYSVVFVESSGGSGLCAPAAPQTENWTESRRAEVLSELQEGMAFWTSRSGRPNLEFIEDDRGPQPTSCEPISGSARGSNSGERLWVADTLTAMGYPATPTTYHSAARGFADGRRNALGADWAFTIFVIDSANDADGAFADGAFAYAYLNGPFMVLTYDNASWGISRMNVVAAHETGHIFGALDEYAGSGCSTSDSWGYLNAANTSCNNGGTTNDRSIMGEAYEQIDPSVDISTSARSAIGWRNPASGLGGTVVDVVRTSTVALTPYQPDPTSDTRPTYAATGGNTAFPPEGPRRLGGYSYGTVNPVSISRFAGAIWSVDGGPYTSQGVLLSGPSEGPLQTYTFQPLAPLAGGTHMFRTKAINNFGHASGSASDTLAISSGAPEPTATSTSTPGPTPTSTPPPTATRTPTPLPTFVPVVGDSDGDGCTDERELGADERWGGRRDPNNPWDFYDLNGDHRITLVGDILTLARSLGREGDPGYVEAYDRSAPPTASQQQDESLREPWDLGPPDGSVTVASDIMGMLAQYGHSCV